MRRAIDGFSLLMILLLSSPAGVLAWSDDPVVNDVVCDETTGQYSPVCAPDGTGGVIVAWSDSRAGESRVYAQRLDANGLRLWAPDGIVLCTYASHQSQPAIATDGEGGAIVVWEDAPDPGSERDLFAQRIDAGGNLLWASSGQALGVSAENLAECRIQSDGQGGIFAAWVQGYGNSRDIYAQKMNAAGQRQWDTAGQPVCTAVNAQSKPVIEAGNIGDCYVAWLDARAFEYETYVQRLVPSGLALWATDGEPAYNTAYNDYSVRMIRDGGDAVILGNHSINSGSGVEVVRAQRLDGGGGQRWGGYGKEVDYADIVYMDVELVSDGSGGACLLWSEDENGIVQQRAQRINGDGVLLWPFGGLRVCGDLPQAGHQQNGTLIADGLGGFFFAWRDERYSYVDDLYFAQRIGSMGERLWEEGGMQLMYHPFDNGNVPELAVPVPGALVPIWTDPRNGNQDIFAQYVHGGGFYGNPLPTMLDVVDFPSDQGGQVLASWAATPLDTHPGTVIESYSVWIREASAGAHNPRAFSPEGPPMSAAQVERLTREGWFFVTEIPAMMEEEYSVIAPSFGDSTEAGIPWLECRVVAHTDRPWSFLESEPLAGYSVDNLAPGIPEDFLVHYTYSEGNELNWAESEAEDFDYFKIYRGAEPDFPPDPSNPLHMTTATAWIDSDGLVSHYYKISAVDFAGNESEATAPETVVGVPETNLPSAPVLLQNAPNPFNPATTISILLPRGGAVARVEVLSVDGRRIQLLHDGPLGEGRHDFRWRGVKDSGHAVASGVYLSRLTVDGRSQSSKMLMLQ